MNMLGAPKYTVNTYINDVVIKTTYEDELIADLIETFAKL
jgi:hypothetical protein